MCYWNHFRFHTLKKRDFILHFPAKNCNMSVCVLEKSNLHHQSDTANSPNIQSNSSNSPYNQQDSANTFSQSESSTTSKQIKSPLASQTQRSVIDSSKNPSSGLSACIVHCMSIQLEEQHDLVDFQRFLTLFREFFFHLLCK